MKNKEVQKRHSKELRELVVEEYLTTEKTARELGEYYGVNPSLVFVWVSLHRKAERMAVEPTKSVIFTSEPQTEEATMKRELTPEEMRDRISELEKALAHEQMKVVVLDKMVEIIERDYKIPVRKKYGAKQSTK
jgi:transposase